MAVGSGMLCAVVWVPRGSSRPNVEELLENRLERVEEGMGEEVDGDEEDEVGVADVLAGAMDEVRKMDKVSASVPGEKEEVKRIEEEEREDMALRDSDAVLVAARSEEDGSTLEVYVYEDEADDGDTNLFIHHDMFLPAFPLCLAWSDVTPGEVSARGSFLAVGSFLPGIDVWNLDTLDSMEPIVSLGGFQMGDTSKARKKNAARMRAGGSPPLAEGSHTAAVMCLSWNRIDREYLASGSADESVKCWDVETAHCVQTLSHHTGKVQAVDWHLSKRGILLSAAFDRKAFVFDARAAETGAAFDLDAETESAFWKRGCLDTDEFIVATEDGSVACYDCRKPTGATWKVQAHSEAASGLSLSTAIPGLMATGSTDKIVKLWDVRHSDGPTLLAERNVGVGAVFGLNFCEDEKSPFLLAAVGSAGKLSIVDTAALFPSVRERYRLSHSRAVEKAEERAVPPEALEGPGEDFDDDSDEKSEDDE